MKEIGIYKEMLNGHFFCHLFRYGFCIPYSFFLTKLLLFFLTIIINFYSSFFLFLNQFDGSQNLIINNNQLKQKKHNSKGPYVNILFLISICSKLSKFQYYFYLINLSFGVILKEPMKNIHIENCLKCAKCFLFVF